MYLTCGPRQHFFQCGPEMPKVWTPLIAAAAAVAAAADNDDEVDDEVDNDVDDDRAWTAEGEVGEF